MAIVGSQSQRCCGLRLATLVLLALASASRVQQLISSLRRTMYTCGQGDSNVGTALTKPRWLAIQTVDEAQPECCSGTAAEVGRLVLRRRTALGCAAAASEPSADCTALPFEGSAHPKPSTNSCSCRLCCSAMLACRTTAVSAKSSNESLSRMTQSTLGWSSVWSNCVYLKPQAAGSCSLNSTHCRRGWPPAIPSLHGKTTMHLAEKTFNVFVSFN